MSEVGWLALGFGLVTAGLSLLIGMWASARRERQARGRVVASPRPSRYEEHLLRTDRTEVLRLSHLSRR